MVRVEETVIKPGSQNSRMMKTELNLELLKIVEQVKELKVRAEEIKEMINLLDGQDSLQEVSP